MLSIFIVDTDGKIKESEQVVSVVLNSESDVPADDLTVTLLYEESLCKNADMLLAYSEDKLMFKGKIDEIVNLVSNRQRVTKISARSLASLLLDNEAEPIACYMPSAGYIFRQYAKPYGITADVEDDSAYAGLFRIEKGMSRWQVIESFCKLKYDSVPTVTGNGRLFLNGCTNDKRLVFGNGGIRFESLRESIKRCELISEVKLKMDINSSYTSHIKNTNPDCEGIDRVRYVNATADNTTLKTADKIISNSNYAAYCITLECAGCLIDAVGCLAEIDDESFGKRSGLVVDKLKYSLGADGEFTTVTLRKEK